MTRRALAEIVDRAQHADRSAANGDVQLGVVRAGDRTQARGLVVGENPDERAAGVDTRVGRQDVGRLDVAREHGVRVDQHPARERHDVRREQ